MSEMLYWIRENDISLIADAILGNNTLCIPYNVEIHITNRCNSSCYFCNQKLLGRNDDMLSIDSFKSLIAHLASMGTRTVRLSGGGEPTTHPQLMQIIDAIYDSGIAISSFDTNGIELNTEVSNQLLRGTLWNLHISLQAPNAQSWTKVTKRSESDFDLVLNNIHNFIQLDKNKHVNVYTSFIIDKFTINELDQVGALCKYLGVKALIHDLNCYTYKEEMIGDIFSKLESLSIESKSNIDIYLQTGDIGFGEQEIQVIRPIVCYAPWVSVLIKPDGNVYPCCGLQTSPYVLGNMLREGFANVWYGEKCAELRLEAKSLFTPHSETRSMHCGDKSMSYLSDACLSNCAVKLGMFSYSQLDLILARGR